MKEEIKEASRRGEEVAKQYNKETQIPFPFEKIEKENPGLTIFLTDLSKVSKEKEEDILGLIYLKKGNPHKEEFEILVEKNKSKERQYFTIAHELGHYFLHKEKIKEGNVIFDSDPISLYRSNNGLNNSEETEANFFAASLLMPEERVRSVWKVTRSVEECARFFDVSFTAMSIRFEVLGLHHE